MKWLWVFFCAISAQASCLNQAVIDFEGGTNGSALSLQALTNSFHGAYGTWTIQTGVGAMYFTNFGQKALGGTASVCNGIGPGGGSYDGSGNLGFGLLADNADDQVLYYYPTNGGGVGGPNTSCTAASMGCWIMTDMTQTAIGKQHDLIFLKGQQVGLAGPGDYINAYLNNRNDQGDVASWWGLESGLRADTTRIAFGTNLNWYWITAKMARGGSNYLSVYNTNLVLLGTIAGQQDGVSYPNSIQMRYHQSADAGTHVYFDSLLVDFDTAVFPLLPLQSSPATGQTLTGGTATLNNFRGL